MACVRRRGKRWVVDYRIGNIRKYPSFETRAAAEEFKRDLLLRPFDQIIDFKKTKLITLQEAINEYSKQISSTKAIRSQDVDIRALGALSSYFPNALVKEVSFKEMESFQRSLLRTDFGPSSVNRYFNTIRNFFKKCLDWDYISENPTAKVKNLKIVKLKKRLWTVAEFKNFYTLSPLWLQNISWVIYFTGIRRGEALQIVWSDVDFENRTMRVYSMKGGFIRERYIPLTEEIIERLGIIKSEYPFQVMPSSDVFLDSSGGKIKPTFLSTNVNRVLRKMNGAGLGLHGMRHSLLTELVRNNVNLETVRKIAGHSTLKTTEQYLHMDNEDGRAALKKLEEGRVNK